MEAVHVFHAELAHAQQPAARTGLVAELGLYLIQDQRQVAVALHVLAHQHGYDLFVRGAERQRAVAAVLEGEEILPEGDVASALSPYLQRLERRHEHLLSADGVQFFTYYALDFLY